MTVIIAENQTGAAVPLTDLGDEVPASGTLTLHDGTAASLFKIHEVVASFDLRAAITADQLLINNGARTLNKSESLDFLTPAVSVKQAFSFVTVGKAGDDVAFNSIKAAVDSITDASIIKPYLVLVNPGVYVEDTIQMKPFVQIHARGMGAVGIQVDAPSKDVIHGAPSSILHGITLGGATDPGSAAVRHSQSSPTAAAFGLVDCFFGDNDHLVIVEGQAPGTMTQCFVDRAGLVASKSFVNGMKATSTGGGEANVVVSLFTGAAFSAGIPSGVFAIADSPNSFARLNACLLQAGGAGVGMQAQDGGRIVARSSRLSNFDIGIQTLNVGADPSVELQDADLESVTLDLDLQHPGTRAALFGTGDRTKLNIDPNIEPSAILSDNVNGGLVNIGDIFYTPRQVSDIVDISTLSIMSPGMGVMEGGGLSLAGGRVINVAEGFGYHRVATVPDHLVRRLDWGNVQIEVPANSDHFIYFNVAGTLVSAPGRPEPTANIVLGRAVTDATSVIILDRIAQNSLHATSNLDIFNQEALGPVYSGGSSVAANGDRSLNVGNGVYFLSQNRFEPAGADPVEFVAHYQDGAGGSIRVTGQTIVDNAQWDDGSGALVALTAGWYAKHSLYVVGDGATEQYLLVYAQAQWASLLEAQDAFLPVPPVYFHGGVTPICSIIVQEGLATISEVRDERPLPSFKSAGVSASAIHASLLGNGPPADDHPQYLHTDGRREMGANLGLGGFNLTNVGLVDGRDVATDGTKLDTIETNAKDDQTITAGAALSGGGTGDVNLDVDFLAPPQGIGGGNTEGVADAAARSDHDHALRETGGPTDLLLGAIADGQFLRRVVGAVVGSDGPLIQSVDASGNITTTQTTPGVTVATGLTITPGAGTYLPIVNTTLQGNTEGQTITVGLYAAGVLVPNSQRPHIAVDVTGVSAGVAVFNRTSHTLVGRPVTVGAAEAIDVRWHVSGGTGSMGNRILLLVKVSP